MLDGGIIQRLLEEKWKTFARVLLANCTFTLCPLTIIILQNQFLKRLLILFIHLFFLSLSVYTRPVTENMATKAEKEEQRQNNIENGIMVTEDPEEDSANLETDAQDIVRYCSEIATLIGVLSYVIIQQGDEIKNQGMAAYLKQLVSVSLILENYFT